MLLTLQTLGALQASTSDAQGTARMLGRGKPVALLAYLACIPGHRASREHLAALLWGDVDSDAARQNLRQTIWYLKKKLGDGLLDATDEMLMLDAPFTSDRDEFLQAAQRADFAAAIQRHGGTFIPDFAAPGASEFEQWCELERRRLTVTFLRCADALARQWLSEGKFRDAQELARRARDVDPMDQSTWRLLLEALIAGSDGLGAASEAEHFAAFLAREEQEPEASSLAAMRAARRSPSVRIVGESSPRASIAAELVGRESEFSRVLAAWDDARAGTPRVLCITAPAGMGKSRLLRDVQTRLFASRSRCVMVRANPGDRHLSGGFVAEVVSQLALLPGAAAVSPGSAGVLVALAPALASLYASAAPDHSTGEEAVRRRAFALVDLVRAVSDEHPMALLLDDLHWADEHSVRAIAGALSRLEHVRMLVVMTMRQMSDPRGLFALFERLELPPLDLAAVSSFVAQVAELPALPWADVLPQQLLLATGGSPLLLVETLHDALDQGWLRCASDGVWQCDDPARITSSLREGSAVRQRVQRLAPAARHALLALSLFGRPLELADAMAMMGGRPVAIDEPLEALERGGFVARNGTQLVVAHDEIADATIDAADDADRRRIHSGIAQHLLATATDETALRRATDHAAAAGDGALMAQAWARFLRSRRTAGDRRSTGHVAADLLGMEPSADAVQSLVSSTPWWQRKRARWVAAAVLVMLSLAGAAAFTRRPHRSVPTSIFAVWVRDSATGTRELVGVRIELDARWQGGVPLDAERLDTTDFPRVPQEVRSSQMTRLPNGRGWWGNGTFAELGEEGIIVDSAGRQRLPLRHRGDDGISGFSPDGRWMLSSTARYDTVTDHSQIVVTDLDGRQLRRLTRTREYDAVVEWRPDGTQILFQRRYYFEQHAGVALCLIDADGSHERCLPDELPEERNVYGWLDNRRVLLQGNDGAMEALDIATRHRESVAPLRPTGYPMGGAYRACICSIADGAAASLYVFPSGDPSASRPVMYRGHPLTGQLAFIGAVPRDEWLETLRIRVPAGELSIDNVYHLRADGVLANGAPAMLHDLRWTSRDPSVATVDSTGRLRPRRLGKVWVIVSAGGWRTDSALVTVTAPSSSTVATERWTNDWLARWRAFGEPEGRVVMTDRGPALLPNGDGAYPSGAYSKFAIPSARGVGFDADVNLRVTRSQWQTLVLEFWPASPPPFGAWDHRTARGLHSESNLCRLGFPGGEGTAALNFGTLFSGTTARLRVPPRFLAGTWHRVRMQLMPDGRCVASIDGVPQASVQTRLRTLPDSVLLMISGNDRFGGRLVVGKLDSWSGVRGGVDWTLLDEDAAPKKR